MKTVSVCVLLATMFLGAHAQVNSRDSDKARVLSLETVWNEAEKYKDAKALNALLSPAFVYTDFTGSFMNKNQFLASVADPKMKPSQIMNEAMRADSYDRVVIITGKYHDEGVKNGKPYIRRGRFTDTWIEQNGSWLCAASQETLVSK